MIPFFKNPNVTTDRETKVIGIKRRFMDKFKLIEYVPRKLYIVFCTSALD